MATPDEGAPLQVHTTKAPGVAPRHLQAWVMGGLAVAMVLVIAFSSRTPARPPKPDFPQDVGSTPPSTPQINQYKEALDREAQRLREAQERLKAEEEALQPLRDSVVSELPPTSAYGGDPAPAPERNWMDVDVEKRGYASRYASNVAVSKRDRPAADHPPVAALETSVPPTKSVEASPPPGPRYRVPQGTVIETVLVNRLDSSFSGPVDTLVTTNVYSPDRMKILIPKGSRILGAVARVDALNQQRLAVTFDHLEFPNGESVSLQDLPGLSQVGETGLLDKVNHHYGQIFGVSLAIGAIAGLSQANTNYGAPASTADVYRQGVSNSLAQSSMQILDRFLNVLPTFTVREGTRIKVFLTADLQLPAYGNANQRPSTRREP